MALGVKSQGREFLLREIHRSTGTAVTSCPPLGMLKALEVTVRLLQCRCSHLVSGRPRKEE